ncbi:hypothetical protein BDP27DRAFT_1231236 [Rhodocollybia butyracea]|uniref:Uncharacterized protein n=1 Tax=Rhodocollybia butyracea TaxID=206335 RepID=A0A9P5PL44_9AGAR|nr:hypothetical protein BDP27DRAFT_1231236 [Rhodocollybia butyracea]
MPTLQKPVNHTLFFRSLAILLFSLPKTSVAGTQITYIDDQFGDTVTGALPTYLPPSLWIQGSICSACAFHPDSTKTYDSTWHDATTNISATVQFNFTVMSSTTLDVYCLLPNHKSPGVSTNSFYNLSFVLDGQTLAQTFVHSSDLSGNIQYNAGVLSLSNLDPVAHTVSMIALQNSVFHFDFATYT